ncbi:MAG: L-histidine N(alpha)-methyltransferase [Nitrospirota bacterium]
MGPDLIFKQQRIEIRSHLTSSYRTEIEKDAYRGLTSEQKFIPSKYFYDKRGSKLFKQICSLPEYYPTRTEMTILDRAAPEIMAYFEKGDIVELGSGANQKIRMFLDAAGKDKLKNLRYVPVDVSETALVEASEELLEIYHGLEVLGIVADFTIHMDEVPSDRPRLIMFLGSTIGNFDDAKRKKFLKCVADSMKQQDRFIVGFDMLKPKKALEAAYNDSRGITSKFNKNVLNVFNRELNADFEPSHFGHLAFFDEVKGRVEMHLRAKQDTEINIGDLDLVVKIDKDETIHTEVCRKFSRTGVEEMVSEAGLAVSRWFFDDRKWFSLVELEIIKY